MRHFLGSVGVRGSVRGPFFTRHPLFLFFVNEFMCDCVQNTAADAAKRKPDHVGVVPNRWNQTAVFGSKSIH